MYVTRGPSYSSAFGAKSHLIPYIKENGAAGQPSQALENFNYGAVGPKFQLSGKRINPAPGSHRRFE